MLFLGERWRHKIQAHQVRKRREERSSLLREEEKRVIWKERRKAVCMFSSQLALHTSENDKYCSKIAL